MRQLSATLLQAQKEAPFAYPIIKVELAKRVGGVTRFDYEKLYEGAEPDFHHAATIPGDGSLIRVRVDPSDNGMYRQRVVDPDGESDFSDWTQTWDWAHRVALCSLDSEVLCFHIGTDGKIYRRESSDNGASWGIAIDMGITPGAGAKIAAAFKTNGDVCLIYSVGATIYRLKRTSDVWGAPAAWSNSLHTVSGIGMVYHGDWNLAITGRSTDADNPWGIWTCLLGDGYATTVDTWLGLNELIVRGATEPYEYHAPFVAYPDVFRIFFVEKFGQTDPYSRPYWTHSTATADFFYNFWREPVPFDLSTSYGLAVSDDGTYAWLTNAHRVYRASMSAEGVNITTDVLALEWRALPHRYRSLLRITLDNTAGVFTDFDKLGWEVFLYPGYKTSEGNEYSLGPCYWITGWEFRSPPWYPLHALWPPGVLGTLVIEAEDHWAVLKRWTARRTLKWAADEKSIWQLLSIIFAKVGLEFTSYSTSSAVINFKPEFEIKEGYNGKWAIKKLLSWIPDQIFMIRDCAYILNPQADDESVYTYNSVYLEAHLLYRGHYKTEGWDPNVAEVWGDSLMVQRHEFPQIEQVYDRLSRVTKPDYPNTARAYERADAELRKGEIFEASGGWCQVTWNVGQDPYDVITITDVPGGVEDRKFRVLGIYLYYDAAGWHQIMKLLLGAV